MKTKTNFFMLLLSTFGVNTTIIGSTLINNNNNNQIVNNKNTEKAINKLENNVKREWIPINALYSINDGKPYNNEIKIEYEDPNNCKIIGSKHGWLTEDFFSFGNGHFTYNNIEYTITEIADEAFKVKTDCKFEYGRITIPYTIKKIGKKAFYNNGRYISSWTPDKSDEIKELKFEEGIEDIGESAFESCTDISYSNTLKLPNSLKHIGNRAFVNTGTLSEFDFTALDHVINIDSKPLSSKGCLPTHQIKKIYFKDEATKNLYLNDKYWKSAAKYFEVKGNSTVKISATLIGGKSGSVEIDITDPKNCIILNCSNNFYADGEFNFNGGKFILYGKEYTITKINDHAFDYHLSWPHYSLHYFFENCILTIPSTIKTIGSEAFSGSKTFSLGAGVEIKFEEGLEYIGDHAFKNWTSRSNYWFTNKTIKLPNSLKFFGTGSLGYYGTRHDDIKIDLTAVDHVIESNSYDLVEYLLAYRTTYVKNEEIRKKYIARYNDLIIDDKTLFESRDVRIRVK